MFEEYRYEVPRDSITLHDILGEGAFGIVRQGTLRIDGQSINVAVKTLKGNLGQKTDYTNI